MSIHAIIPARSGSKRFPDKNITSFLNIPLFYHSIFFAKKIKFVKKIIFSTDSEKYIRIAKKIPDIIIQRSPFASKISQWKKIYYMISKNFILKISFLKIYYG